MPLTPNTKGMFNDDAFGKVGQVLILTFECLIWALRG